MEIVEIMPTESYIIGAFVNAVRQNIDDIQQVDIDGGFIAIRPSKSYWIAEGWDSQRWADYQLPQVSIFYTAGNTDVEDVEGSRYDTGTMKVDIYASGRNQRRSLSSEIKRGLLQKESRNSLLASGLKLDRIISDIDSIEDEINPQDVYIKSISFRVYYHSSGG